MKDYCQDMRTQNRATVVYHCSDEHVAPKKKSLDLSYKLKLTRSSNAFGRAVFLGEPTDNRAPTKYVRVSNEDKLEDILTFMLVHWKLMVPVKPGLCISLTGSKASILGDERKKHILLTGLIQATQATNAWIMTSGLNAGTVNLIDEALQHGQFHNFNRQALANPIRCIGIAPWGCVINRDQLLCKSYEAPVRYDSVTVCSDDQAIWFHPLHTHCIFVDDGQCNHYDCKEVASFLSRLSERMAAPVREHGLGIPTVLLVIGDGFNLLVYARASVIQRVPVVVCAGTGAAADLVGMAFSQRAKYRTREFKAFSAEEARFLKQLLTNVSDVKDTEEAIDIVTQIVMDEQLITVFDMDKSDDLHVAILYALIKINSRLTTQLRLALCWNRSDIARDKIFRNNTRVDPEALEPIMMDALLEDKTEFVGILMKNGIYMRQFLTLERLHRLYNEASSRNDFVRCLAHYGFCRTFEKSSKECKPNDLGECTKDSTSGRCGHTVYLTMVSALSRKMLGRFLNPIYELDTPEMHTNLDQLEEFGGYTFPSPYQELFLWAIYHQRQKMAKFFWEQCDDAIILALIACMLYTEMKKMVPIYDTDALHLYAGYINEFEMMAVRVLEECNSVNPAYTSLLIERETPLWGGYNCLSLANKTVRRKFISSVACQSSLNHAWSHGIQGSAFGLVLSMFCPLLLLSDRYLKFADKHTYTTMTTGRDGSDTSSLECTNDSDDVLSSLEKTVKESPTTDELKNNAPSTRSYLKKVVAFYTAPRTKFLIDCFAYLAFLLFFTYTLMSRVVAEEITTEEALLMTYFIGFLIDEIYQITLASRLHGGNLRLWLRDCTWVQLDTVVVSLSVCSMVLRIWKMQTFIIARTCYAITMILCYMRVFRLYGLHPALGPKMVMIQRMLAELTLFILILLVMLIAYGSAMQSLLFPYRTSLDWTTIKDVFYYPYWNLYGELYLDHATASQTTCTDENDITNCPSYNFMVPVLLAFYMLFASVLLLNLLIAIFSNVFQQVEDHSVEIWKFNIYALVVGYNEKPILPVPFSALQVMAELLLLLIRSCSNKFKKWSGRQEEQLSTGTFRTEAVSRTCDQSWKDNGAELFAFTRRETTRLEKARGPEWKIGFCARGQQNTNLEMTELMGQREIDEELRIARLFETHCMRNLLYRQEKERNITVTGGMSHIKSRIEELHKQMNEILDRLQSFQQTVGGSQTDTASRRVNSWGMYGGGDKR